MCMFRRFRYRILKKRLRAIEWLLLDIDGVLTDGRIIVRDDGIENKHFHSKDGFGIYIGKRAGLNIGVISGRDTPAVRKRLGEQLKIEELHLGKDTNKHIIVDDIAKRHNVPLEKIAFAGDELIDAKAMQMVGISFCPADAADEIKKIATIVTKTDGGKGAVREIVMLVLEAKGVYDEAVSHFML